MPSSRTRSASRRARGSGAALLLAAGAVLAIAGCRTRGDDPALAFLRATLKPGERVIALRDLEPVAGGSFAAVVVAPGGKPELRLHQSDGHGSYVVVFATRQGDIFRVLALDDVNADGRDEIVATWRGGHLEMIEVVGRNEQGAWVSLFQEAGREIERRYGAGGTSEFWITSRTYEEGPGQPPAYATSIYRWSKDAFVEAQ